MLTGVGGNSLHTNLLHADSAISSLSDEYQAVNGLAAQVKIRRAMRCYRHSIPRVVHWHR